MESVSLWTTNPDSLRALWGTLINQRDRAVPARARHCAENIAGGVGMRKTFTPCPFFKHPALSCSPLSL